MARPKSLKENEVVSFRIEKEMMDKLRAISALESFNTGKCVSAQELQRRALEYVYGDNEVMRECFRRSRAVNKKYK